VDWIELAQVGIQLWAHVNMVMNLHVPLIVQNLLISLVLISFLRTLLVRVSIFGRNRVCFLCTAMCTSFKQSISMRSSMRAT
jgi:hypothetical protein